MHPGSCECKSIKFQYDGEPLTCYACHCTDCQTTSGSAFTLSMLVKDSDLSLSEGTLTTKSVVYNGTVVQRHHCPDCGVALWYSADTYPGIVALKPGTFDNTSWFRPVAHLWVRSAQPWVILGETAEKYETQPEMSELLQLWADRNDA